MGQTASRNSFADILAQAPPADSPLETPLATAAAPTQANDFADILQQAPIYTPEEQAEPTDSVVENSVVEKEDEDFFVLSLIPAELPHGEHRQATFKGYAVSLAMHAVLLILLGLWILPQMLQEPRNALIVTMLPAAAESAVPELSSALPVHASSASVQPILNKPEAPQAEQPANEPLSVPDPMISEPMARQDLPERSDPGIMTEKLLSPTTPNIHKQFTPRLTSATAPVEVVSSMLIDLDDRLAEGDTTVIWLLDQSLSMQAQIKLMSNMLAEQLKTVENAFAAQARSRDRDVPLLMHVVACYGATAWELTGPTHRAYAAMREFSNVPVDLTGIENTFSAVQWAVQKYVVKRPENRRRNVLVFVLTDESGDDYLQLEQTIEFCRQNHTSVSIIGPSAVLGQQTGYHLFLHPENNRYYNLPVTRGPETAFPERARIPYWFRNVPRNWNESERGPWNENGNTWLGGSDRLAILSGFGPYALTRLTQQTGGTYTIFDRPADRSPYPFEKLRDYLPDYRRFDEIQADAYAPERKLRKAVLTVAEFSHGKYPIRLPALQCMPHRKYVPPESFPAMFQVWLNEQTQTAQLSLVNVNRLLNEFDIPRFNSYYESETPRWQAYHDYTKGHLLSTSVRLAEFIAWSEAIRRNPFLEPGVNTVTVIPSPDLLTKRLMLVRAQEAKTLLTRCVEDHRGTPWQYLAERELQHDLGLHFQKGIIPKPPPPPPRTGPPTPPSRPVSLPRL